MELLDSHPLISFQKGDRVLYGKQRQLRGTVRGVFFEKRKNEPTDQWVVVHFEWQDIGDAHFHPHELRRLDLIESIGELE